MLSTSVARVLNEQIDNRKVINQLLVFLIHVRLAYCHHHNVTVYLRFWFTVIYLPAFNDNLLKQNIVNPEFIASL